MTVIYVCTDTRWQSINLVPALVLRSIDFFLLLSARRGVDFERADEAHAARPQRQLKQAYEHECLRHALTGAAIFPIIGPLVGVQSWRRTLVEALRETPENGEIVVNYLSGPSDIKVASWLALEDLARIRPDLKLRCVLYDPPAGKQPSRLEWNEWNGAGWDEQIVPIEHLISFHGWLLLHGTAERKAAAAARSVQEKLAAALAPEIRRIFALVFEHEVLPAGWFVEMSGAMQRDALNNLHELSRKWVRHPDPAVMERALADLLNIAQAAAAKMGKHPCLQPEAFGGDRDFVEFLRAGWFEMLIFLELQERLSRTPGAIPVLNAKIDLTADAASSKEPAYELDVGVIANNQFHYIECKAYRSTSAEKRRKQNREHLNHLRRVKEDLVGPGGIALLASAVPNDEASATARYAEYGHLEFATGWPAISDALDRIVQRCG